MSRAVEDLIAELAKSGLEPVDAFHSLEVLRTWGLPVPDARLIDSAAAAVEAADEIGYPVVLKVQAKGIVHKTDVGGVRLGLTDGKGVEKAYGEIWSACGRPEDGLQVMVQRMVDPGLEVIIGTKNDRQFGQAIMFGLGGVFVEVFEDVTFSLIPVDRHQAVKMICAIQAYQLLEGYRGSPGVDEGFLADLIVSISDFILQFPSIVEMDLNPVIAHHDGASIVDARILFGSQQAGP